MQAILEPTWVEHLTGFYSNGRFLTLPTYIRQGWNKIKVKNALAYYSRKLIATIIRFYDTGPWYLSVFLGQFFIIISDRCYKAFCTEAYLTAPHLDFKLKTSPSNIRLGCVLLASFNQSSLKFRIWNFVKQNFVKLYSGSNMLTKLIEHVYCSGAMTFSPTYIFSAKH